MHASRRASSSPTLQQIDRAAIGTRERRGIAAALRDRRARPRADPLRLQVLKARVELLRLKAEPRPKAFSMQADHESSAREPEPWLRRLAIRDDGEPEGL